jgi:hypothetical protein
MSEFMNEFLRNIVDRHTSPTPNVVKPRLRGIYEGKGWQDKLHEHPGLKSDRDEISDKGEAGSEQYESERPDTESFPFKESLDKNKSGSAQEKNESQVRHYLDTGRKKLNAGERKDSDSPEIERMKPVFNEKNPVDSPGRHDEKEKGSQKHYRMEKSERKENTGSFPGKFNESKNRVKKFLTFNWSMKASKRAKTEKENSKTPPESLTYPQNVISGKTAKTFHGKARDSEFSVSKQEPIPGKYETNLSNKKEGESGFIKSFRANETNKEKEESNKTIFDQAGNDQYILEGNRDSREHHSIDSSGQVDRTSSYARGIQQNARLKLPLNEIRPEPQQTIRVTIGQIVVKAVKQERNVPQKPANSGRYQPKISLSDYLSQK